VEREPAARLPLEQSDVEGGNQFGADRFFAHIRRLLEKGAT
jgi:hypothetical protein